MDLSFFPLTLEAVDQAAGDALCLFVEEDERPLTGLAGLADWRLRGGLSRYLRAGLVKGTAGEALLTRGTQLGFLRMFVFGMGPRVQSEDELAVRLAEAMKKLALAGVEDAAFAFPGRLSLERGVRTLIDEPLGPMRAHVFAADPAALVRALSHAASRSGTEAHHERRVVKVPGPPRALPLYATRSQSSSKVLPPELPKASPLPFAPTVAQVADAEARMRAASTSVPQSDPPYAPLFVTEVPPVQPTPAPPRPQAQQPPPVVQSTETAPAPLPSSAQPPVPAQPPVQPQSLSAGQPVPTSVIPVTRKPARFAPPAPQMGGKGRKKKR